MYGRRKYRKSFVPRPLKTKYSLENTAYHITGTGSVPTNNTANAQIIPAITTQGMRKCKHFNLSLYSDSFVPVYWALVFVPNMTSVQNLTVSNTVGTLTSLYEPNQFVIMCGVLPGGMTTPLKCKAYTSRNLNSDDSIYLIVKNFVVNDPEGGSEAVPYNIDAILSYAIAF